jgi:hypothetical protein
MRLAMTCGYRVFVCSNMAFAGDFTPVLAKHSKSFSLIDCISVGVDRMQRNFEPMRKQVEAWQRSELTNRRHRQGGQSTRRSSRVSWKLRNILPGTCMTCSSSPSTRTSGRGRSGVSRTRSHPRSRNWSPFHNSKRRRSWASSLKLNLHSRSSQAYRAGRPTAPF